MGAEESIFSSTIPGDSPGPLLYGVGEKYFSVINRLGGQFHGVSGVQMDLSPH